MNRQDFIYRLRGIDPEAKRAYVALFNNSDTRRLGTKVIEDLIMKFKYYGAAPTNEPIQLAKNAAYREVIEYILTMAARVSDDTLDSIERMINREKE